MSQLFNVVRCFSCSTFQVSQVKKAKKWSCKVCGEKQSLTKVYGQGTGTECRHHVQKLNLLRQNDDEKVYKAAIEQDYLEDFEENDGSSLKNDLNGSMELPQTSQNSSSSKWSKFLPHEDDSTTTQPQKEESDYTEEYYDGEEIRKIAQNSDKFFHRQKRKNSFLKAHSGDPLPNSDDLIKKPRNTITNYFQLSSINQNKSHNWSHSVSVGSPNPGTNLITRPNPIRFGHFTPNTDPLTKISSTDTDLLKNKNGILNSSTFKRHYTNLPRSTEHKETDTETFKDTKCGEKDLFLMDNSQKHRLSNEGNSFPQKESLANEHSRTLSIIYGLKARSVSTRSTEDSYPRNINNNISLISDANKRKTDVDGQILLSLPKLSKCKENVSEQNLSVLNNLDKEKSAANSCSSNFVKDIFQIDESELELDF